jgi:uridine kinase
MHLQFVEPSKRYADIIIPEGGFNDVGIDLITGKIRSLLGESAEQGVMPVRPTEGESDRPEFPS